MTNTEASYCDNYGIYLSSNGNWSSFEDCHIFSNGTSNSDAAFRLSTGCMPTIINCTIGPDNRRGFYIYNNGLILDGNDNDANVIYNNGTGVQTGTTGAEFYATAGADPSVNRTNIWDIRDGERQGIFVYNATTGNPDLDFENCYFGDDWDGAPAFDEETQEDFFVGDVDFDDWSDTYFEGADEPQPDDLSDFDIALNLMSNGYFQDAVPYFWRHVEGNQTKLKVNALQRILWCVYRSQGDLAALKDAYLDYADGQEERVRYAALDLACFCTLYDGYSEQAAEELSELRNVAPSIADSLVLEMDISYANMLADGGDGPGIDAVNAYDTQMRELDELLDNLPETTQQKAVPVPADFALDAPYPNPFNATVNIRYQLPSEELLRIAVYDLSGREVAVLKNGKETVGYHSATWQADGQASGVYFCRMEAAGFKRTVKIILAK